MKKVLESVYLGESLELFLTLLILHSTRSVMKIYLHSQFPL